MTEEERTLIEENEESACDVTSNSKNEEKVSIRCASSKEEDENENTLKRDADEEDDEIFRVKHQNNSSLH